jgi:hypothetical protein
MRSWLKFTLESGVLETLRPSEASGGDDPESFARRLLARLREADGGMRPDDPPALAFRAFRRWVDAERRSRRRKMLEDPPGRRRTPRPSPVEPSPAAVRKEEAVGKPPSPAPNALSRWLARAQSAVAGRRRAQLVDLSNPLWDRWLDG